MLEQEQVKVLIELGQKRHPAVLICRVGKAKNKLTWLRPLFYSSVKHGAPSQQVGAARAKMWVGVIEASRNKSFTAFDKRK